MEWHRNKSRNEIIKTMLQQGESVSHIAKIVQCSKSTVHYYAKKIGINHSTKVINRIQVSQTIASKAASQLWSIKREEVRSEAINEWTTIKADPELLSLVALYWAEGTKRGGPKKTVSFSMINSDPGLLKATANALTKLGFDFNTILYVYETQDPEECKQAWQNFLGTKPQKTYIKKWKGQKKKLYSKYGLCVLRVPNSFVIWNKIMTWIECWRDDLGISESCQLGA